MYNIYTICSNRMIEYIYAMYSNSSIFEIRVDIILELSTRFHFRTEAYEFLCGPAACRRQMPLMVSQLFCSSQLRSTHFLEFPCRTKVLLGRAEFHEAFSARPETKMMHLRNSRRRGCYSDSSGRRAPLRFSGVNQIGLLIALRPAGGGREQKGTN